MFIRSTCRSSSGSTVIFAVCCAQAAAMSNRPLNGNNQLWLGNLSPNTPESDIWEDLRAHSIRPISLKVLPRDEGQDWSVICQFASEALARQHIGRQDVRWSSGRFVLIKQAYARVFRGRVVGPVQSDAGRPSQPSTPQSDAGQPTQASTPQSDAGQPTKASTPQSDAGQPTEASTPQSDAGQPQQPSAAPPYRLLMMKPKVHAKAAECHPADPVAELRQLLEAEAAASAAPPPKMAMPSPKAPPPLAPPPLPPRTEKRKPADDDDNDNKIPAKKPQCREARLWQKRKAEQQKVEEPPSMPTTAAEAAAPEAPPAVHLAPAEPTAAQQRAPFPWRVKQQEPWPEPKMLVPTPKPLQTTSAEIQGPSWMPPGWKPPPKAAPQHVQGRRVPAADSFGDAINRDMESNMLRASKAVLEVFVGGHKLRWFDGVPGPQPSRVEPVSIPCVPCSSGLIVDLMKTKHPWIPPR